MKHFINFIIDNWQFFATFLSSVIGFIVVVFIKKKPVYNEFDNILVEIYSNLPAFIKAAEVFKGAENKKALVIESVKKFVLTHFHYSLTESQLSLIGFMVEEILSTPQKKETK